jgi:hypothetical protein
VGGSFVFGRVEMGEKICMLFGLKVGGIFMPEITDSGY